MSTHLLARHPMARTRLHRPGRGLSLIEPLAVTALVGALAATAAPRLLEAQPLAEQAALAQLAGAATTAMALNQAGCALSGQQPREGLCQPVADCRDVAALLLDGVPAGWQVEAQPLTLPATPGSDAAPPTACRLWRDGQPELAREFSGLAAGLGGR